MLATLGLFVFQLKTAPFQKLRRSTSWRWASNHRVGQRASYQFLGPDKDAVTLTGVLMPAITGGPVTLDLLRAMGDSGKAWALIGGDGYIYGLWIIESIEETRTELLKDGTAQHIAFSIHLKRADNTRVDQLGALTRVGGNLL